MTPCAFSPHVRKFLRRSTESTRAAKRLRREGASLVASAGAPARGMAEERGGLGGSLLPSLGLSPSSFSSGLVTGRVRPTGRVRGHLLEVLVLAPQHGSPRVSDLASECPEEFCCFLKAFQSHCSTGFWTDVKSKVIWPDN